MSAIILPNRLRSQPQQAAAIDYGGLAKGICILWNPAAGPVDQATGRVWTRNGNAAITHGHSGKVFSFDGTDDYYSYTGYPELNGNVGTFFMWCPVVGTPDTHGHVVFSASSPTAVYNQIYPDLRVTIGGNLPSSGTVPSWFNTRNRSIVFASGGTAATCKVFLDGKETGLTWSGTPASWGAGNKNFNLGRYSGGTSWDFSGTILVAGFANVVWGEAESRAFHENPWRLFKGATKKLWLGSSTTISLTGTIPAQSNGISSARVIQDHALLVSGLGLASASSAGKVKQGQILVAVSPAQTNAHSTGAITMSLAVAGAPAGQVNASSTGEVTQAHLSANTSAVQGNVFSGKAITQTHILIEAAPTAENTNSNGAISIGSGNLAGASLVQANPGGTSAVTQAHAVVAVACSQINNASAKAISNGVLVEPGLIAAAIETGGIKKPGIPSGTPAWLKTMIEILIGRRGNRITRPEFRPLTFSATPTRAECEALYAYVNTVRDSLEQLISRMDG